VISGSATEAWCRILVRRLPSCRASFEAQRAFTAERATVRAYIDGAFGNDYEAWERYRDHAPADLQRLDLRIAETSEDLATAIAGEIPPELRRQLPRRDVHCRWGDCRRPKRRRFPIALLRSYPLTQPKNVCRACGWTAEPRHNLDLDHMAELVMGGADHPFNLIRVCGVCHENKEFYPDEPVAVARLLVMEGYGVRVGDERPAPWGSALERGA
jgi:hypothetical protein